MAGETLTIHVNISPIPNSSGGEPSAVVQTAIVPEGVWPGAVDTFVQPGVSEGVEDVNGQGLPARWKEFEPERMLELMRGFEDATRGLLELSGIPDPIASAIVAESELFDRWRSSRPGAEAQIDGRLVRSGRTTSPEALELANDDGQGLRTYRAGLFQAPMEAHRVLIVDQIRTLDESRYGTVEVELSGEFEVGSTFKERLFADVIEARPDLNFKIIDGRGIVYHWVPNEAGGGGRFEFTIPNADYFEPLQGTFSRISERLEVHFKEERYGKPVIHSHDDHVYDFVKFANGFCDQLEREWMSFGERAYEVMNRLDETMRRGYSLSSGELEELQSLVDESTREIRKAKSLLQLLGMRRAISESGNAAERLQLQVTEVSGRMHDLNNRAVRLSKVQVYAWNLQDGIPIKGDIRTILPPERNIGSVMTGVVETERSAFPKVKFEQMAPPVALEFAAGSSWTVEDIFRNIVRNAAIRGNGQISVYFQPLIIEGAATFLGIEVHIVDSGIGFRENTLAELGKPGVSEGRIDLVDREGSRLSSGLGYYQVCKDMEDLRWLPLVIATELNVGSEIIFTIPNYLLSEKSVAAMRKTSPGDWESGPSFFAESEKMGSVRTRILVGPGSPGQVVLNREQFSRTVFLADSFLALHNGDVSKTDAQSIRNVCDALVSIDPMSEMRELPAFSSMTELRSSRRLEEVFERMTPLERLELFLTSGAPADLDVAGDGSVKPLVMAIRDVYMGPIKAYRRQLVELRKAKSRRGRQ